MEGTLDVDNIATGLNTYYHGGNNNPAQAQADRAHEYGEDEARADLDRYYPSAIGRFHITDVLGQGSYGKCFLATDSKTGKEVAIKIESLKLREKQLKMEQYLYDRIHADKTRLGFSRLVGAGVQDGFSYMVISILHMSLDRLVRDCPGGKFSLKTLFMVADQAITRLQTFHGIGFIHQDLKPGNLMVGSGRYAPVLYLIDFGMARPYLDDTTRTHIACTHGNMIVGTKSFLSVNMHKGIRCSRRDDMESLLYVLIKLGRGSLPWDALHADDDVPNREQYRKVGHMKETLPEEDICEGLPSCFAAWLRRIKNMRFEDRPDYVGMRKAFQTAAGKLGIVYDAKYDWS